MNAGRETGPPRRLLGTDQSLAERVRVYRTADALEVDLVDYFNIRRRRVFFDEVELVTLHSGRGLKGMAVGWVVLTLLVGLAGAPLLGSRDPKTSFLFFGIAGGFALGALLSLFVPVWTVTVFGKRTRARMRFRLRQGKARRVYDEVCRAAGEAQEERPSPPAGSG
jgi:hypothetical protein